MPNLGFGHNGATEGYLSLRVCYPETDVSVIVLLPYRDLTNMVEGPDNSFGKCLQTLQQAGWAARKVFGYPGN